jgi:1-acyl-sn-glycerol-3-phosphate acyltransferase
MSVCVAILRPLLMLLTKRRWLDGDKLPATGGCVVVGNHISYADPLTFAHFVYDNGRLPRFLAKSEVFDIPVVGAIVRSAGQIPVYRMSTDASRAFRAAVEGVQHGECVIVYPEGTITRQPELWPMTGKTGAARIELATGGPLIPLALWGAHEVMPPYRKTFRILPRKTMQVVAGPPVDLSDLSGRPLDADTLRTATERLMDSITELLEGLRGERAPVTRFDPRRGSGSGRRTNDAEGTS